MESIHLAALWALQTDFIGSHSGGLVRPPWVAVVSNCYLVRVLLCTSYWEANLSEPLSYLVAVRDSCYMDLSR